MARQGLLLINLGTPDSVEVADVRRYLREFLSDPRVLDINPLARAFILNVFILPRRPRESAAAYRKIWTERGSPLLFHSLDLTERVRALLGDGVQVELAMRYQSPSIESALRKFREAGVDRIVAFPLFPQYSSAATGSAVEKLFDLAGRFWNVPSIQVVPPFFDHPSYLDCFAESARPVIEELGPEKILMSFHGLPERHMVKSDESGGRHCLQSEDCCDRICEANRNCYRAQCFVTARGIASRLELDPERYSVCFQSRLGRDPWIRPFTDEVVLELARSGVKRLAVLSPAFVADCLETLEEIAMRARDAFVAAGGEDLRLVPSLNSEPGWAEAVVRIANESYSFGVR